MGKKILIIDDEVDVMKMLVYRLKAKGFKICTAATGLEGINLAKTEVPDIILLDYRLPDLRAEEVSAKIKAEENLKQIPIILVTASVEKIEFKAKDCNAVDFLSKPVEPEDLYLKITKHLA